MIQNIIVALIVTAAFVYAGYSVYRSLRPGDKRANACGGCTGCDLKNMKNSCEHTSGVSGKGIKNKVFEQKLKSS